MLLLLLTCAGGLIELCAPMLSMCDAVATRRVAFEVFITV